MKKILYDLTHRGSWGDKSYSLGHIAYLVAQGNKVYVKTANWNAKQVEGEYDPLNEFKKRPDLRKGYTFNPKVEPVQFFSKLIVPSLGCEYYDVETGYKTQEWSDSYDETYCPDGRQGQHNYFTDKNSKRFEYKLSEDLKTESYYEVLSELKKTKNILLYTTWDENMDYVHGYCRWLPVPQEAGFPILITKQIWEEIKEITKKIDDYCLKNKDCRIVLVSKRAKTWEKFLKSDFLNLRNFESRNLNIAQVIELLGNNASSSMGYTNSMNIWLNLSEKIKKHVNYHIPPGAPPHDSYMGNYVNKDFILGEKNIPFDGNVSSFFE